MVLVLIGLPGVGKTRLALALGARWATTRPTLVLHTDLLKVTLRSAGVDGLRGPGWADPDKALRVHPWLTAQAQKADREGYDLIIEGTLALGFEWPGGRVVRLELDEAERVRRITTKHASARAALAGATLAAYRTALRTRATEDVVVLDAQASVARLVEQLDALRYTPDGRRR